MRTLAEGFGSSERSSAAAATTGRGGSFRTGTRAGWVISSARGLAVLALVAAVGCEELPPPQPGECSSGEAWTGGDEESPLMHPGLDCVACHEQEGEGPLYAVAGTVMGTLTEPDDCFGVEGVVVRLTDADGGVHELVTNAAGNFFTLEDLPLPYTAEIVLDGQITAMLAAQTVGSCNSCHAASPTGGAPGRILAP